MTTTSLGRASGTTLTGTGCIGSDMDRSPHWVGTRWVFEKGVGNNDKHFEDSGRATQAEKRL